MNEWEVWLEQHKDDKPIMPERLRKMHGMYGSSEGHICKDCQHLKKYSRAGTWYKCALTRITGSAATDWKVNWPACGKWQLTNKR